MRRELLIHVGRVGRDELLVDDHLVKRASAAKLSNPENLVRRFSSQGIGSGKSGPWTRLSSG